MTTRTKILSETRARFWPDKRARHSVTKVWLARARHFEQYMSENPARQGREWSETFVLLVSLKLWLEFVSLESGCIMARVK